MSHFKQNISRGPYVVFEVEYLWNSWIKEDGANANLVLYD